MNTVIAMSTIQSSSPDIERAATQQTYLFVGYVSLLLLTLVGTVLLYRAGNRYQDAVKRDADARIAEAGSNAAQANERAQNLEHDNLILRNDLNTESGKVAGLQKAASDALAQQQRVQTELSAQQGRTANLEKAATDAKAAQQGIQTELAKQQERAANAERALLKLREEVKDRDLTAAQRKEILEFLRANPKGTIRIAIPLNNAEAMDFALILSRALKEGGWNVRDDLSQIAGVQFAIGLSLVVESPENHPPYAAVLQQALNLIGFPTEGFFVEGIGQKEKAILEQSMMGDKVLLMVGGKPKLSQ